MSRSVFIVPQSEPWWRKALGRIRYQLTKHRWVDLGYTTDVPEPVNVEGTFHNELTKLLNRFNVESDSDTPDFIIAEYIRNCLDAFAVAAKERDNWYQFEPWKDPT